MIKAIIFDFYGVLCTENYWQELKQDPKIARGFSRMADSLHLGLLSWKDYLEDLSLESGRSIDDMMAAYNSERLNLPLAGYITELHKKYKTGLLSNATYEAFELRAKEIGFDKLFDATVVSSKVGLIKPDPKIYEYILNELGVKAQETAYIDDVQRFIDPAKAMGMKTILYEDFGQMKDELEKILNDRA